MNKTHKDNLKRLMSSLYSLVHIKFNGGTSLKYDTLKAHFILPVSVFSGGFK